MELENLKDLYLHELKDLYSAENQLIKALPKMAEAATSSDLADGFKTHLEQTKEHATRLEQILKSHDETTSGPKCKGMEGVIAAGQRAEHYEMAGYGTARTYAKLLGDSEGEQLLQQTLDEELATDKKLTQLAESINVEAQEPA